MNIFNDIQEAYWQYQHDWGVIPNLLFMNAHDYHQSIKNVEVGMPNIMSIHEIARNTFLGCEVFLINNPTFKGIQFRELNDLLTAIKHECGYLSGDIKVYKHKPLDIDTPSASRHTLRYTTCSVTFSTRLLITSVFVASLFFMSSYRPLNL